MKKESECFHIPILPVRVIDFLEPKSGMVYVDATVGTGGHAEKILEISGPAGKLIGIDIDPSILEIAGERLKRFGDRCLLFERNYTELPFLLKELNIISVDGIVFDLGVNMKHFLDPERGFSFSKNGPLDMRMTPKIKVTAEEIINRWSPEKLIEILYKFGEERQARRIVRRIAEERRKKRIRTTNELAELIARAAGGRKFWRIHPATRTFQALRIVVNDELQNLETALPQAIGLLNPGARICVISFHSLEDRIVKNLFRLSAGRKDIRILTKKPLIPSEEEVRMNVCSRSAKLRVAERI